MKKPGVLVSCTISAVIFLSCLVKGDLSHALLILLLIFGAITGQLICTSEDEILNIWSFAIVLLCSFIFGIYSLAGGDIVTGILSAVAALFAAVGFASGKSKK